tara:strand:- start:430 stop:564 length:135 start_codon:yes stop_codon:yes gene_type:complete
MKPELNDAVGWANEIAETIKDHHRMGLLTKEQAISSLELLGGAL